MLAKFSVHVYKFRTPDKTRVSREEVLSGVLNAKSVRLDWRRILWQSLLDNFCRHTSGYSIRRNVFGDDRCRANDGTLAECHGRITISPHRNFGLNGQACSRMS